MIVRIPMMRPSVSGRARLSLFAASCIFAASCSGSTPSSAPTADAPASRPPRTGPLLFVTNEVGGDLTVIDPVAASVVTTIKIGKRPRGITLSPDRKTLYVAVSGTPIAGPGVDDSKLPPADKKADGIGVVSVDEMRLVRVIKGGSDPENVAVSTDGTRLFVA